MVSVFNLEELNSLFADFYRITGLRIVLLDDQLRELVAQPESRPEFCQLIRSCTDGSRACAYCDREACRIAAKMDRVHIYRCHAGLTEAVMPLHAGNALIGYVLFGHVFAYDSVDEGWETISRCCAAYPLDKEALRKACGSRPQISKDYIRSAARILHATASYLILERMATLREDSAAARLDEYLNSNFTQPITAQTICQTLDIGRTRLYKLSQRLYGKGPAQQLRQLRMDRAKALLLGDPDLSISQVAQACGYDDYNYFISVFTQHMGISPGRFRKQDK